MGLKKVTLKSSDDRVFEVEEAAVLASQLIKNMIEDDCANDVIPLPNVTSDILSMVIEYCKKHVEMQKPGEDNQPLDEDLQSWDADFVKVDMYTLFDLNDAADYLSIESLVNLTYQALGDMLQLVCKAFKTREEYEKEKYKKKERRLLAIMAHVEEEKEGRRPLPIMAFMERWEEERRLLALMYF